MTTIAVPRRRILRPRLPKLNLAGIKRLGDPSFNRLGIRGHPWGFGRAGGAPGFLPSDLDDLVLWLRADTITGLNDGDPVATWPDDSGLGNDAVEAVNRPTYRTGIRNGLPVVRFDGVNEILTVAGLNSDFTGITEGTLFVVFSPNNDLEYSVVNFSQAADEFWRFAGTGNSSIAVFRTVRLADIPAGQPTVGWHYHTIRSGPINNYDYRRDGSLDFEIATAWGLSVNLVLADNPGLAAVQLDGDIAEVILYAAERTDAEVDQVETYEVSKWGF